MRATSDVHFLGLFSWEGGVVRNTERGTALHLNWSSVTCDNGKLLKFCCQKHLQENMRLENKWTIRIENCDPGQGRCLSPTREQWTGCKEHQNRTAGI